MPRRLCTRQALLFDLLSAKVAFEPTFGVKWQRPMCKKPPQAPAPARWLVLALPLALTTSPLGDEPSPPAAHSPPPHEINVWGDHGEGLSISRDTWATLARQPAPPLPPPRPQAAVATGGVGAGFSRVGSVAVLEGDELTTTASGTGFGINKDNLAEISRRFIGAFGDDYDQIAVFLGFTDRLSQQSLAYQQPVKNDIRGLGLGNWDETERFGSKSGRMESMLNMKRINIYGRDAANEPENDLYSVWAQEAAHRWAVYFKYRLPGDNQDRQDLLLRQNAHWAPWVHAEGSFLDGMFWQPQPDGTYVLTETNKRYGTLDQYAMGLRSAEEVPPFFMLDGFSDEAGSPIKREGRFSRGQRYRATRIDLTVEDIVRAMGPRVPATSPAAEDLRMGVVFLTPPGIGLAPLMGEAFRVETTRAPWDGFYNASSGGRAKVCTELLRPCRGPAFSYGPVLLTGTGGAPGVVAPGDTALLTVPVANVGTEAAPADVTVGGLHPLELSPPTVSTAALAPGQSASLSFTLRVPPQTACGVPFTLDFQAPGRLGPSKGTAEVVIGLQRGPGSDLEDQTVAASWLVDPEGTDTALSGRWAWGTPEETKAFDFVLQPGAAASGLSAFVTDPRKGERPESNDVDFDSANPTTARTTLQSPPYPLAGLVNPKLAYQLHFVAAGFEKEVLVPGTQDAFYVQASFDGGPWVEVDRVPASLFLGWQARRVTLAERVDPRLLSAGSVRFRFVAEDHEYSETVVEAAIDDVFLLTDMPGCGGNLVAPPAPPPAAATDGGGCRYGGSREGPPGLPLWLFMAATAAHAWQRHTRRR